MAPVGSHSPGSLLTTAVASAEWLRCRIMDCQSFGCKFEYSQHNENPFICNFLAGNLGIPVTPPVDIRTTKAVTAAITVKKMAQAQELRQVHYMPLFLC